MPPFVAADVLGIPVAEATALLARINGESALDGRKAFLDDSVVRPLAIRTHAAEATALTGRSRPPSSDHRVVC
eukprot:7386699-Prymnesium_polylepis.2